MTKSIEQTSTQSSSLQITAGKKAAVILLSAVTTLGLASCKDGTTPAPNETHPVVVQPGDTLSELVDDKCNLEGNWGQIQDGITETIVSNNMPSAEISADSKLSIVCPPKE